MAEDLENTLKQILAGQQASFARGDERHRENGEKLDAIQHDVNGMRQVLYPLQERVKHVVGGLAEHKEGMGKLSGRLDMLERAVAVLAMKVGFGTWLLGAVASGIGALVVLVGRELAAWLVHGGGPV